MTLRKDFGAKCASSRAGLLILLVAIILVVIALGVGLGIGLTGDGSSGGDSSPPS